MAFLSDIQEKTVSELESLIESRDFNTLREQTKNWSATDIADLMEPLPLEKQAIVFRLLPREQAAKVLTDATEKFSDNAAVLKDTLLTALYVPPPTGYTTALAAADQLRRNFPESMDDPQVQLWIAAANGQKFANLKDGPEREAARTAALEAVRRVIALSPDPESRVRITLRKIFNPAAEGSNPTENDLEVFKDDLAFQELIKPKPENPQPQDPRPQHPQP